MCLYDFIMLHRAAHAPTTYIPENFLDKFLHLIIWGHEHECLIDPVSNTEQEFDIIQPGSSVATSLVEGEAKQKYCNLSLFVAFSTYLTIPIYKFQTCCHLGNSRNRL